MRNGKRVFIAFIMLGVLAAGAWASSVWLRIHEESNLLQDMEPNTNVRDTEKHIVNILVLGLDQLKNERARADSIMVMSINEDTDEVAIISIPRDARVQIPGKGLDKINHAMAYKGEIALMKKTVEELLGAPIHHYIYTNFNGFIRIVDILGGIEVDVPRRMVYNCLYHPINLQPGRQRLSGAQALQYVRFRSDSQGDFGRMVRQQEFVKIVAEEALQVRSVLKLPQLLEQAARHLRTDMSIPQALAFARRASKINLAEVTAISLPGNNINVRGVAYVALDQQVLQDTVRRYILWEKDEEQEKSALSGQQ